MDFNWLVIDPKKGFITKDFEVGEFIQFQNVDLSFYSQDILQIQFGGTLGSSFIQKLVDGKVVETPISSVSEVPNLSQIISIFEQRLEENKEPAPSNDDLMFWLRANRNERLQEADIQILRAFENGETPPASWVQYRQALRDLPAQVDSGTVAMPTFKDTGTQWVPFYSIEFSNWPAKPL